MARKGENIRRRKDGRWEGRYISSRKPDGKAVYTSVYGKRYREVKEKLIAAKAELSVRKAAPLCSAVTVDELMKQWLEINRIRLKESTVLRYSMLASTHISPGIGSLCVSGLTAETISGFLEEEQRSGRKTAGKTFPPDMCTASIRFFRRYIITAS